MQFLFHTIGSHGDILPFTQLGTALKRRGHTVHFFVHRIYAPLVRAAGLQATSLDAPADQEAIFKNPDLVHQVRAHRALAQIVAETTPCAYAAMLDHVGSTPTVLIGSSVAFACRLLQETHGLPCVTVHLAPSVFRSAIAPARLSSSRATLPAMAWPAVWWLMDRCFCDPHYGKALNQQRAALGLPRVRGVVGNWLHDVDLVLGCFPSWFAPAPDDWPANLHLTGFPLPSQHEVPALPADVERFLQAGTPPIGFTPGTYTANAREYFQTSAAACVAMNRRAIFLTRFRDQLPPGLPASIAHFDYVPFEALLPHLTALVHHGGIGTLSQALRAGVPQLIRPTSYDQFDNSARVCRLGIAAELLPRQYTPGNIAATIERLLDDENASARRIAIRQRMTRVDGIEDACDAILRAPFCRREILGDQHVRANPVI